MLNLNQLIDNAARTLIRTQKELGPNHVWGWRLVGLTEAIADRVGGTVQALDMIHQRYVAIQEATA
jgi:glycosyltransferase A (GT-A) superfamily protein (DUF2064 family)